MGLLFVSHSSKDNDQAVKVRDWLYASGWKQVFLDLDPTHGLAPGQRWQQELKDAGENCSAVIILISPHWVASRWCQTEFLVADQLGKRIFPIFVAPTSFDELPIELKAKFQLADISTPDKETDGFHRLALGLKRAGLDPTSFEEWPPPGEPQRSVYRGLQALDVQDAPVFFGRDAAITKGLDELRRLRDGAAQKILVILGASGAGKSSFLRAGLLARLERDTENFVSLPVVRPERSAITGAHGLMASLSRALRHDVTIESGDKLIEVFAELRRTALAQVGDRDQRPVKAPTIVLSIDQAEELFNAENLERAKFLEVVGDAISKDGNTLVLATIRTDSYAALQKGWLPEGQRVLTLPPIAAGSFREIIQGPARLAKPPLKLEPALMDQLLVDLDAADALPLLAFTLEHLEAECAKEGEITLADYLQRFGGLSGAIQSAIDDAIGRHPSKELLARARRLFVPALVRVDQDGAKRRVARRSELPPDTMDIFDALVAKRILVVDSGSVEITHEAILRHWPSLSSWLADDRAALALLDGVQAAAREWTLRSKQKSAARNWLLHRGERLRDARVILARPDFAPVVEKVAIAYISACRAEEARAKRNALVLKTSAAISAIMILAVTTIWFNWDRIHPELVRLEVFAPFVRSDTLIRGLAPGSSFEDCRSDASENCPVMVVVPGGEHVPGEPRPAAADFGMTEEQFSESPLSTPVNGAEPVELSRFAVSETEITFDHWKACADAGGCRSQPTPSDRGWGRSRQPVIEVSAKDAEEYVSWLSRFTGAEYRLLTRIEWEYAATGETQIAAGGARNKSAREQLSTIAIFASNSNGRPQKVKLLKANGFGLYDMMGNVAEWVKDCVPNPGLDRGNESQDLADCNYRPIMGGSWASEPEAISPTARTDQSQFLRRRSIGFRVGRFLATE
jgi:formylglycine-generating enzyme required for sulfatase activity